MGLSEGRLYARKDNGIEFSSARGEGDLAIEGSQQFVPQLVRDVFHKHGPKFFPATGDKGLRAT